MKTAKPKPKKDHYATLGVKRGAGKEEIKRAHRKRARETHPDAGGDREEFEAVQRASLVLLDDARRERYDRTGEDEDGPRQDPDHAAMTLATDLFQRIIAGAPDFVDPVATLRQELSAKIRSAKESKIEGEKFRAKMTDRRRRLKGEGPLAAVIDSLLVRCEIDMAALGSQIAAAERALELVKGHGWEPLKEAGLATSTGSMIFTLKTL